MKNEPLSISLTGLSNAEFAQQLYARNFLSDHIVEQLCNRLEDSDATWELADLEEKVEALACDLGEMTEENRDLMKNNQLLMEENKKLYNELHHLKLFGQG